MSSAIMQHFSNLVGYAYEGTGGIVYALNRTVSRDTSVAEQYPGRVTNMYNYNDKVYAWSPLQAVAHASPHPSTISAAGQSVAAVVTDLADAVLASSPFPSRAEDSANTSAPPSAADDSTQVEENLFCFIFFLGSLVLLVSLCVTVLAVYFGFVRPRMVEEEAMYKALAKEAEEAEAAREAERAAAREVARAAASNARASAAHTQGKASNASSSGGALLTGPRSMPSQRALSSRSGSRTDLRTGPVLPQPQQNPFAAPLSRNPSIVGASPGLAPPPPTPPLWVGHVGSRSNMGSFVFQQPPPPTQLPPPPLPFLQPQLQPQLELRPQPQLPPQPQQAPAWEEEGQQPLRRRTSRVSFKANITESM